MNYPTTQSSLLERVQNGDEISWNEFYFRYAPVIRAAGSGVHFNDAESDNDRRMHGFIRIGYFRKKSVFFGIKRIDIPRSQCIFCLNSKKSINFWMDLGKNGRQMAFYG